MTADEASVSGTGTEPVSRASFRSAAAYGSLGFGSNVLVSLISSILTARLYGIKAVAEYALAYAPTGAVWFLSSVREQPAMVRILATLEPRAVEVTRVAAAVFAFSQGLTIVVALLVDGLSYVLFNTAIHRSALFAPASAILWGYVWLANPGWNIDSVLAAFRAGQAILAVRLNQALIYVIAAVGLWFVVPSVWGLALALVISYGTSTVHRLYFARRFVAMRLSRVDLRAGMAQLPSIVRFGLKTTPGTLAAGVSSQAGTWILGAFAPLAAVGGWSRASMIGSRLTDINSRISDILLPTLVERRHAGDSAGFDRALIDSMRYLATAMLLPAAAAGGAARGVMAIFGTGFTTGSESLALMMFAVPLLGALGFETQVLLASNRPLATTALEAGRMIVTVGVTVALAARLGATGVAVGVVAGCACELLVATRSVRQHLTGPIHVFWPYRSLCALIAAYVAGFVAARLLDQAVGGFRGVLVALPCGCVAYVAVLVLLGGILPRDRERLAPVASRLRRR